MLEEEATCDVKLAYVFPRVVAQPLQATLPGVSQIQRHSIFSKHDVL